MQIRWYWAVVVVIVVSLGWYQAQLQTTQKSISGIVIPHHDLVRKQREQFLQEVSPKVQPDTIILVSPNHYNLGRASIQTMDKQWQLSEGNIESRPDVIHTLIEWGIGDEPGSFPDEHGIHLVLSDLHTAFPNAKIVPLIIKSTVTKDEINSLADTLFQACKTCLMVASVDFSHYQPALLANLHDTTTIRAMQQLDFERIFINAEVDSPGALLLLSQWAERTSTKSLIVSNHTNSGELLKDPDTETTTHLFAWYEEGEKVHSKKTISFLVGGDVMMGRMVGHTFLSKGLSQVFEKVGERAFWGVDAGIINLEGPISRTPVPDDYRSTNLIFNFPPQTIQALRFLRVNAVSLANNHSANQGRERLDDTRSLLHEAGITPIGGPGDQHIPDVGIFKGHELHLVVIGVHTLYGAPDISDLIRKYKEDPKNRVLIFPHWGTEYKRTHNVYKEGMAHDWIDAGADLVIGAHPHVIQDSEVYKGRPIIYSLGNFVFDQNFSKETQEGLLIAGSFDEKGLMLFGLPIEIVKYQPTLMRGNKKRAILEELYRPLKQYIQHGAAGEYLYFPL